MLYSDLKVGFLFAAIGGVLVGVALGCSPGIKRISFAVLVEFMIQNYRFFNGWTAGS